MPASAENIHRMAQLTAGSNGRRWLVRVDDVPGPWVVEEWADPYWTPQEWEAFTELHARAGALDSPFLNRTLPVESDALSVLEAWVTGPSLMDAGRAGGLPLAATLRIGAQVATAMAVAHEAGVPGQRTSPWDVRLNPLGVARLSRWRKEPSMYDTRAITGRVTTPTLNVPFLSPEALMGEPTGPEANVFALGASLFYALEGRTPFDADTMFAQMQRVLAGEIPSYSRRDVPERVEVYIRRMMHRDPTARPTAAHVAETFSRESGGQSPPALRWSVSECLERLRGWATGGDLEPVTALFELRPELTGEAAIRDYLIPYALEEESFSVPGFCVLSRFPEDAQVAARLELWSRRELESKPMDEPARSTVDLGPFQVEACTVPWSDMESASPTARICEACGHHVREADDAVGVIEHADGCVHADPSEPGFWARLRKRLTGGA